jgi:hypothetical protein
MNENVIKEKKFDDGNKAVIVEFGTGKIGIGLGEEGKRSVFVHLQELNEPKDMGAFLTREEREDNFNNPANPLEVILGFPDLKSIDNFIETLKIYRQKVFLPNVRTRSA